MFSARGPLSNINELYILPIKTVTSDLIRGAINIEHSRLMEIYNVFALKKSY